MAECPKSAGALRGVHCNDTCCLGLRELSAAAEESAASKLAINKPDLLEENDEQIEADSDARLR
ncbi:MAG: hypothetical protein WA857_16870 [Candidatus Acidiferrum sp.]